ncbi:MAG: glycosyltransferase, partial [Planctomycetota bacterium]
MPTLHVVIPVFNERRTLEPCLDRVVDVTLPDDWSMRLCIIDDHSANDAFEHAQDIATKLAERGVDLDLHRHTQNLGKGAALQTGFDAIMQSGGGDDVIVKKKEGPHANFYQNNTAAVATH